MLELIIFYKLKKNYSLSLDLIGFLLIHIQKTYE
jgi:hypothetical protein